MSDGDPILGQLGELLERARREAYERGHAEGQAAAHAAGYAAGYADAVRKIVAAASAGGDGGGDLSAAGAVPPAGAVVAPPPPWPAPGTAPFRAGGPATAAGAPRRRARRGSLESRLLEVLADAPLEGVTIAEIEAAAASDPEPLKLPSIRVALLRLHAAGRVARDGRRWRLVAGAVAAAADDDGPGEDDDGGVAADLASADAGEAPPGPGEADDREAEESFGAGHAEVPERAAGHAPEAGERPA